MTTLASTTVPVAEQSLWDFYHYPAGMVDVQLASEMSKAGFFQFGSARCFGSSSLSNAADTVRQADEVLPDALSNCYTDSGAVHLPFDLNEVASNLRLERYVEALTKHERKKLLDSGWVRKSYYLVRKLMPVHVRKHFQRMHLADWRSIPYPSWPVDCSVDLMFEQVLRLAIEARGGTPIPFVWFWPNGHDGCMILTHDVEQAAGRDFCPELMRMNESAGLRASFQIVPEERYDTSPSLLDEIRSRGHEVNVHDLNHDGRLYQEKNEFLRRAEKIAAYGRQLGAEGFRSAVLYRNLNWYDALQFDYDMSVPNTAHLDPQRGGCCTVMPYFIGRMLELPLTATQDYSLFHILRDYSLGLWEKQIRLILERHGLLSFNIHPDYIQEKRARAVYETLLDKLAGLRDTLNVWAALPREVNQWWRERSQLELVPCGEGWKITGAGSERASIAYASLDGDRLVYNIRG